jgi:hypothetical protein
MHMPRLSRRMTVSRGGASFSPLDLPGLVLWLDASRITGLSDSDPVAQWDDLSGLSNHAAQATGSKRPTYKVNIVNGRPVVRFDGVDDWLPCGTQISDTSNTYIAAVLVNYAGAASARMVAATQRNHIYASLSTGPWGTFFAGAEVSSGVTIAAPTIATLAMRGSGDFDFITNGAVVTKTNAGAFAVTTTGVGSFGGTQHFYDADLAEVVICAGSPVSSAHVRQLNRYLGAKYGISVS